MVQLPLEELHGKTKAMSKAVVLKGLEEGPPAHTTGSGPPQEVPQIPPPAIVNIYPLLRRPQNDYGHSYRSQGGPPRGTCWMCGEPGYFADRCPYEMVTQEEGDRPCNRERKAQVIPGQKQILVARGA